MTPERIFVRGFGSAEGLEWGLWLALTVFWIVDMDLSPSRLVLLGIVLEVTVLLSETPTGVIADVRSRRTSLVIAQALMGLSFIWAFASTNFWAVLPAQALLGFAWTFRSGADTAWISDEVAGRARTEGDGPSEDGTADEDAVDDSVERLLLQRHRWGMMVSLLVGPLTIAVGWRFSVQFVGILIGVIYTLFAGWMAVAMTEDHFTPGKDRGMGFRETLREGVSVIRNRPRLRVLVAVVLLLFFGSAVFDRLGWVHFLDNVGVDDLNPSGESLLAIGILFFVAGLGGIGVNTAAQRRLETGSGIARLAVALLAVAAVGGLVASATNFVVVIGLGYLLQDSVREALYPVLEGWANRDAPSEVRATVHSLMGQSISVGEISGAFVFGAVAEATSIPLAMAGAAASFGLASLFAVRGVERQ